MSIKLKRKGDAGQHIDRVKAGLKGPDRVKVGFPMGAAPGDVLSIATFAEFGTRTSPERPFVRNSVRSNRGTYEKELQAGARKIVRGEDTKTATLSKLGVKAAGDIQRGMPNTPPPNKPSTVAKKGSSVTLIDTGRMRQAVTWKLDK